MIKHYSYDNDIPFYAPISGLAEQGAAAAVSVSHKEMGRMTAAAAEGAFGGRPFADEVYSKQVHVSINRAAAEEAGLTIPAEAFKSADKVFR